MPFLDEITLTKEIKCGYSICVGVRIAFLPQKECLILACAMDNFTIDLYIEDSQFSRCLTLKGHEDWVRGLDFTYDEKGDLLLASTSQDYYIRLWRFAPHSDTLDSDNIIKSKNKSFKVSLDSILTGHEGWVYSANWNPKKPQLLSSSLDKSMIIWELDPGTNLWIEKIRVGEVGGNTLGFYGGVFSPDGQYILAHGYNGAFHLWKNTNDEWEPCITVGGHAGEVTDLAWDPHGEYLMTVSADQTTRIHAPWRDNQEVTWHEIARPQVHGYDMSSVAVISRYKFASSAEEKVIRTFEAPRNFVENFARICKITEDGNCGDSAPKGASVPSLGLSNKAVFASEGGGDEDSHFTEVVLTGLLKKILFCYETLILHQFLTL